MKYNRIQYQNYNETQKHQLKKDVLKLMKKIAPGLSYEQIGDFFFKPEIKTYRYFDIRNKQGDMIAFFCGYYTIISINGKPTHLYNARVNVDPNYQGKSIFGLTYSTMFRALASVALVKGGYFVSNMVNPLSYYSTVRTSWKAYPRHDAPLESHMEPLIYEVGKLNGYQLKKSNGIIKTVKGVSPDFTEEQIQRIKSSKNPDFQYLDEKNVDYLNGEGMMIVVPYSRWNIFMSMFNSFTRKKKKYR